MHNGVAIIGNSALAATASSDASKVYSKNVLNFSKLIIDKDGNVNLNFEDDIVKGTAITNGGKIVNERVQALS
jgi:NAD(P) transhydrogenase subunit alpha